MLNLCVWAACYKIICHYSLGYLKVPHKGIIIIVIIPYKCRHSLVYSMWHYLAVLFKFTSESTFLLITPLITNIQVYFTIH